jgi:hypothetical protein
VAGEVDEGAPVGQAEPDPGGLERLPHPWLELDGHPVAVASRTRTDGIPAVVVLLMIG